MLRFLLILVGVSCVHGEIVTRPLAYIKVANGAGASAPFTGTADKLTYDTDERYMYVIGGRSETLQIYDLNDPTNPTEVHTEHFNEITDGIPQAIAFCRNGALQYIAIAFSARNRVTEGHVEVFRPFLRFDHTIPLIGRVATESDPVSLEYESSCARFVVACKGLPGNVQDDILDPLPHIDIFERTIDAWIKQTINFVTATGLENARYIYRNTEDATHSVLNDLEPSDLTITSENIVYVSLQANNAVAKFNLNNVDGGVEIYSLGWKNWNNFDSDTSDQDDGISADQINLAKHNIRSFYQPTEIVSFTYGQVQFLVTANTGDSKRYTHAVEGVDFHEAVQAGTLNPALFDPNMDPTLRAEISNDALLGRLYVSELRYDHDGWNTLFNFHEHIYMYGGRSWSLWDENLSQQYDSGDNLEFEQSTYNASLFNGDCTSNGQSPPQSLDSRSIFMGPEPGAIATGLIGSKQIVIVGSGRMGGLFIYNMVQSENPLVPTGAFESYTRLGEVNGNWGQLYAANTAGTPHINDIKIVQGTDNVDLLLVLCTQLGTVAVHELYEGTFP